MLRYNLTLNGNSKAKYELLGAKFPLYIRLQNHYFHLAL